MQQNNEFIFLHYTRSITPKRVTGDKAYLRGVALGQDKNIAAVASRWRQCPTDRSGIELKTIRVDSHVFTKVKICCSDGFKSDLDRL